MQELSVKIGQELKYQIKVQAGIMNKLPELIKQLGLGSSVMIITDETVNGLYGQDLEKTLQDAGYEANITEIPVGETYKVYNTIGKVYNILKVVGVDRGTVIISLGGGVVGDLAGFVAATWQRGLPLIQVPTTVMAQVDSSIGGKVAVNHFGLKNLIGTFYHPQLVVTDPRVLITLSDNDYNDGLAEVVKTALLSGAGFLEYIKGNAEAILQRNLDVMTEVIRRCAAFKAEVVSRDPEDHAERRMLNLGHTLGHALEEAAPKDFTHGEAVSVGLHFALKLSQRLGFPEARVREAVNLLHVFGLPTAAPGLDVEKVLSLLSKDKKARAGVPNWVLLKDLGHPVLTQDLPDDWKNVLAEILGA